MKTRMILLLALVLSLVLAGAVMGRERHVPPVYDAIVARNEVFMETYAAGDWEGMGELYTENALLGVPDGPMLEGKEAIAQFWQALMEDIDEVILYTWKVDALGDTANEISWFELYVDGVEEPVGAGKYIVVWKRVRGKWYLHWDIFNFGQ